MMKRLEVRAIANGYIVAGWDDDNEYTEVYCFDPDEVLEFLKNAL